MRLILCTFVVAIGFATPSLAATTYTYDTLGRVSSVTYDNGLIVVYSYDSVGNRTQVVVHS